MKRYEVHYANQRKHWPAPWFMYGTYVGDGNRVLYVYLFGRGFNVTIHKEPTP
jgi:hypothetical protein